MIPLTWNADTETLSGRRKRTDFHVKWINYLPQSGVWQPIDMSLARRAGVYEMRKAPFAVELPLTSTGQAVYEANNLYSVRNKRQIADAAFHCLIRPLGVKDVPGTPEHDRVVYQGAYGDFGDLILNTHHGRVPRLRKLIRFNQIPNQDVRLEFELEMPDLFDLNAKELSGGWDGSESSVPGNAAILKSGSLERGIYFSKARIWDSGIDESQKAGFVPVSLRMERGRLILTKHIPVSFFVDAVFPVFTDTDFYPEPGTTVDGWATRSVSGESWSDLRDNAGTGFSDTNTESYLWGIYSNSVSNQWERNRRAIFLFDTSFINGDEISAAAFGFYNSSKLDQTGWSIAHLITHLVSSDPAAADALEAADYNTLGETSFGTIAFADVTADQYNDIELNAGGLAVISTGGITRLGVHCAACLLNEAPNWGSHDYIEVRTYFSDYSGTSRDPILSVTHAPPAAAGLTNRIIGVV